MTAPGRFLSFDQVAGDYDQTRVIPPVQMEEIVRRLGREAKLERGGLFLDAGVGTGRFAAPLARLYPAQVAGVDVSLAMMRHAATAGSGGLPLAQADLQRLPFQNGAFQGVLLVHILHLVERWPLVLSEAKRVLAPKSGVLFLGTELGGRSALVDFYLERARARRVLPASLGTAGLSPALSFLRRRAQGGGLGASVTLLEPQLAWKRSVPTAWTLEALARRTYSQMWAIPGSDHAELLLETEKYARQTFRKADASETLLSRFSLYAARW